MPFNPDATSELTIPEENLSDFLMASEGQWFIGVIDTHYRSVYILPIDPGTKEALANTGQRNRNRYASGSSPTAPIVVWDSCDPDWLSTTPRHTTHERVCAKYKLDRESCVGFTIIKLNRKGSHALVKLTSNSMNMTKAGAAPHHSFSRSTADHHAKLTRVSERGFPIDDLHKPGTTPFSPGTFCMPPKWATALKDFLAKKDVKHVALSFD